MIKKCFLFFINVLAFVESADAMQKNSLILEGGEKLWFSKAQGLVRYSVPVSRFSIGCVSEISKRYCSTASLYNGQVFSRPTYDRIAKYILSEDESIRIDILKAFTGIESISSARQLDHHFNPFDPLNKLRSQIGSQAFKKLSKEVKEASSGKVYLDGKKSNSAYKFLKKVSNLYDGLFYSYRKPGEYPALDFLCETDSGPIRVEFQVAQQDHEAETALACAAEIYSNQLGPDDDEYLDIGNVIGVTLLGDGSTPYWKKDGEFRRSYTFTDEYNRENKITSLKLIQYSLGDVDLAHPDLEKNERLKQWIEFFKSAHEKQTIPISLTVPVRKAYDMIRVDTLKKKHPRLLKATKKFFVSMTAYDKYMREEERVEGKEKGRIEGERQALRSVAKQMRDHGKLLSEIMMFTGLGEEEIKNL